MRRLPTALLGMAAALMPAALFSAPGIRPRRRRAQVAKAPKSNHAEIAAWNQAVERRNAEKRAKKLAAKARTNRPEKEHG